MLLGFELVHDVYDIFRGRFPYLADLVVAELERYGKQVLEVSVGVIDLGEVFELVRYQVADSPLLGVLLQNQKYVNQVLLGLGFELGHKLGKVANRAELDAIHLLPQDVIQGGKQVFFGVGWSDDLRDLMQAVGEGLLYFLDLRHGLLRCGCAAAD